MIDIKLYDRNLTSPTPLDVLTGKIQGLTFGTRYHGGYYTCSFRLRADLPAAWEYINDKIFNRLVVADGHKTLFEGRLEDFEMSQGAILVTAYGYFANLSDIPYYTAYNATADVAIKAILTANCSQISSDQTHIAATDITVTSAADASYADIYPHEHVAKLLKFSDSTSGRWYFGIWEDRIPWLVKRSTDSVTWRVRLADLARFRLGFRGGDLWNRAYAIYQSGGSLTRTAEANDTNSQTKYGDGTNGLIRSKVVPDLGAVAAAAAQAQRDYWKAEYAEVYPRLSQVSLGEWVWDGNGVRYPSSWVRAGEVIRVVDLIPASADLATVSRNRRNTFYITETRYEADRRENALVFDTSNDTLAALLARGMVDTGE